MGLMLSHFHSINLPDPGLVDDTYYLENVHLEKGVAMNILEFPYTLSKYLPSGHLYQTYYFSINLIRPAVDYVPVPSHISPSALRSFLGKVDQNPARKGFIPIESDRAHGSPEVFRIYIYDQ